jgi:FkbM family methyltransferase
LYKLLGEAFFLKLVKERKSTSWRGKLLPNNYQFPPSTYRITSNQGIKLKVDLYDYIGHHLFFKLKDPSHEQMVKLVQPGYTVIDIGANIGYTLLQFAKHAGEEGFVYGFEPDPYNFQMCKENIALNRVTNACLFPLGLGNNQSHLKLKIDKSNRGRNRISTHTSLSEMQEIEVTTLDRFFYQPPPVDNIDLIKIDVEGFEMKVLQGGENLIDQFHPILFIELDDNNLSETGGSARELIEWLEQRNYLIKRVGENDIIHSDMDFEDCHYDIICKPG